MAGRTGYNSEDESARTAVAGQIAALQSNLQSQINSLSGGGDPEVITALQDAVDALEASQADLSAAVAGKADMAAVNVALAAKATITALTDGLAAKASQSALDALSTTVTGISTALGGKANSSDVAALLAGKASTSSVTDLSAVVADKADAASLTAKADVTAVNAALATKAPASDMTSAQSRLNSLEARPSGIQFPYARGAVVFTWDDGWSTHPAIADMHASRGQAATFYVTSNLLGTSQHMASSDIAGIMGYSVGHEIGCHSADHTDMTTLNSTTRAAQWASKATIEGFMTGGKKITSYAYPLGNNNLACNQEAYGRFDRVAAIGLSQGYYTGSSGYAPWLYEPDFEGFRHGRFPWSQSTHAQFMSLLKDHVRRRQVVLTAYAHQMGNPDTPTQAQIEEAMNYCQANGIPCLTTSQALPGPKLVNPGFEDGLDGWTVTPTNTAPALAAVVDVIADAPGAGLAGTKSLRIQAANMTSADSVHVFQTIPVRGDTGYSASARIRHDGTPTGAGKYSIRINEYDEMGASITGTSRSVRGTASTGAWAQSSATPPVDTATYVLAGRTRSETRYMTVGLYIQEYNGTFYADHVHFGPTEDGLLG